MTIREALRSASQRLESAGVPNASYDAMQMLAHVLGEDALMMRLNGQRELAQDKLEAYEAILARREMREPAEPPKPAGHSVSGRGASWHRVHQS